MRGRRSKAGMTCDWRLPLNNSQRRQHETPSTPFFSPLPMHPPPLPTLLLVPQKENSLEKAVGGRNQPTGVDEDSSADVHVSVQQTGLPWPLAGHHVLASIDSPHHLGLPTHCGDNPSPLSVTDTLVESQMPGPGRLPFTYRWEKQGQGSSGPAT